MENTVEKVIEIPNIRLNKTPSNIVNITYEFIDMLFEMLISFLPIILYWLSAYLTATNINFYEHVKNGSIIWIFLAMLVAGNFKLLITKRHKDGIAQRIIIAFIIIFMLLLLSVYLILNFSTYGVIHISLNEYNTTCLVLLLGIATFILNTLRIVFFIK